MTRPKLKRDWEGRHVRLVHDHTTKGGSIFPKGEIMLVERNFGGLHLAAVHACSTCRLRYRHRIKDVDERDVVLLSEDYVPPVDRI